MSDVTIKYNNNTIGEMNDTGAAVLQTANKKRVSDIEVEYTKPAPENVTIPVYTQVGVEGELKFAKNITATAGEAITDKIPIPVGVNTSSPPVVGFEPGLGSSFHGSVKYDPRNSTIIIDFYMPNRMPGNADKFVISMEAII